MAVRGGSARRLVGSPLGGVLRDLDRQARRTTRSSGRRGAQPPVEGPRGPRGPAGASPLAAAVLEADGSGRVRFEFPEPFPSPPVVAALPAGATPAVPMVEDLTTTHVVVRLVPLVADAPLEGIRVHVTATAATTVS